MKPAAVTLIKIILLGFLITGIAVAEVTIPESVNNRLQSTPPTSEIELILSFENDLVTPDYYGAKSGKKSVRVDRYRQVVNRLNQNINSLKNALKPQLQLMLTEGKISEYEFFTVSKSLLIRTTNEHVDELINLPGVRLINLNSEIPLVAPVAQKSPSYMATSSLANSALADINVPYLWSRGLTGKGSLICSFDTGVDGDHPALTDKWRGNYTQSASAAWFAPRGDSLPYDNLGHGSHSMGIMLGSTGTDTIGVAPDAQWISAAVIDQGANLSATIADILNAFDWVINPDGDMNTMDDVPDVLNNSWGVPQNIYSDCNNTFWTAIENIEAAGIVAIFAAGNEGPDPQSLRNPADLAGSPLNSLAVGSVNQNTNIIADFSSRGPSSCGGAIKPDIVAPGVSIYSSFKDGTYRLMSGTSMSAPFISGLVALMRQYNPEATVTEIKAALLSATTDLGVSGADNVYGHGYIDASKIFDFLPVPNVPHFTVGSYSISSGGDAYADPGENAGISLTINEPTGKADSVDVWMISQSEHITILPDTIRFYFAQGSNYATNYTLFSASISANAVSGERVSMKIFMNIPGIPQVDTAAISILIGRDIPGQVIEINSESIQFSVSDFGQFGFGLGSIYQAGGHGFKFNNSPNLLYEAGLIIGRNPQLISDGIRDENGKFKRSDFLPGNEFSTYQNEFGFDAVESNFHDGASFPPIPIEVKQTAWTTNHNYSILVFDIYNPSPERLDNLSAGFFCDFDMDRFNDALGYDSMTSIVYQYNPSTQIYVGLVGLSMGEFVITAGQNETDAKSGFTPEQKYELLTSNAPIPVNESNGDWHFSISQNSGTIDAFAASTFAVAIIAGNSLQELREAALIAQSDYGLVLDAKEEVALLPHALELSQNYPNPFNPETAIQFVLKSTQHATLDVYNIIGQNVRNLYDEIALAGEHNVIWDGKDNNGQRVASGVYFYRLTTAVGDSETKKMILMK
ncbi:MAG: S8 family serine peptidase [candidate division Zixibacteria bacterium]